MFATPAIRRIGLQLKDLMGFDAAESRMSGSNVVAAEVDHLETRELPTPTVALGTDGVLRISGDGKNDRAVVNGEVNGKIKVDYWAEGEFWLTTPSQTFNASSISRIEFRGNAGNDRLDTYAFKTVWAWGGTGNDYLDGGNANDWFNGEDGNDTVIGSGGNDTLNGANGEDYLAGGSGVDDYWGGANWDRYNDAFSTYIGGVTLDDVDQQQAGTCTILAAIGSTIGWNTTGGTNWGNRVKYVNSTQYDVKLFRNGAAYWERVNFDNTWSDEDPMPQRSADGQTYEAWVVVAQRAVLDHYGVAWETQYDANWGTFWRYVDKPLPVLTGVSGGYQSISTSATTSALSTMKTRLDRGFLVAGTRTTTSSGIIESHAYSVISINTTAQTLTLFNPWGVDGRNGAITGANDGLITISWTTFKANFHGYGYV